MFFIVFKVLKEKKFELANLHFSGDRVAAFYTYTHSVSLIPKVTKNIKKMADFCLSPYDRDMTFKEKCVEIVHSVRPIAAND